MTVIWFPRVNLNLAGADASYSKGPVVQLKVRGNSVQRRLNGGWTGVPLQILPEGLGWTNPSELFKSIWVTPSQGEPHGRTLFGNGEQFCSQQSDLGGKTEGIPRAEGQD